MEQRENVENDRKSVVVYCILRECSCVYNSKQLYLVYCILRECSCVYNSKQLYLVYCILREYSCVYNSKQLYLVYCILREYSCVYNSKQLYQWSDRVVRTVVRPDWQVRSGHVTKEAHMIVTPAVTVSFSAYFCFELYLVLCNKISSLHQHGFFMCTFHLL